MLKQGDKVRLSTGETATVKRFLGGGGQGEVFSASVGAQDVALKWYFEDQATPQQRKNLENLVRILSPDSRFLWPESLATAADAKGFGYTMGLREPRFKGLNDLMSRRINPSFRVLALASYGLADGYLSLHSKGLSYRDISFGNAFLDPATGDIRICDNDNVAVDDPEAQSGVAGTPRFMAPEIVLGQGKPSTETDLWSLAVLLFYMFVMHHPLEGKRETAIKCIDLPAMSKLYGEEALFVFDPDDRSNEPDPDYHANPQLLWPMLPTFLRNLFTKTFTSGIRDPQARVRESEWKGAMIRLADSIVYGPSGQENFYCQENLRIKGAIYCWDTGKAITLPPRIKIDRHVVMLNHDSVLYPHHVDPSRMYDLGRPVAKVTRHATDPNRWGLENVGMTTWIKTSPDGESGEVAPGQTVGISVGLKIGFGKSTGEIRI